MAELLVAIGVAAALAAVIVGSVLRVHEGGRRGTAEENLSVLNAAVLQYNQAVEELVMARGSELAVIEKLKTRDAGLPGSPYLDPSTKIELTSSTSRNRGVWNGRFFELAESGVDGTGIDLESTR